MELHEGEWGKEHKAVSPFVCKLCWLYSKAEHSMVSIPHACHKFVSAIIVFLHHPYIESTTVLYDIDDQGSCWAPTREVATIYMQVVMCNQLCAGF